MRRGSPAKILVDRGVKVESVLCTVPAKRAMEPELAPPTIPTLDMNGYHFTDHHSREALSIDQSQAAYLRIGQHQAVGRDRAGLLGLEGWSCIPTAQRHFDADLQHALRFIGALSS